MRINDINVTWPRGIKTTLISKKYFQKIMLIYVYLLCIKYSLLKVTDREKSRVRNSPTEIEFFSK